MLESYFGKTIDLESPTLLFKKGDYEIYWLGIDNETAFRCNVYLIKSGDECILVDPSSKIFFEKVKQRVAQITDPSNIVALLLCHQDPDVAASMTDWLDFNPNLEIITSTRTNVLLPHYGKSDYDFYDICEEGEYVFENGEVLKFIESPFLHFPGAFTTYDEQSKFLFSGDIWAALDIEWELIVEDFSKHIMFMDMFHEGYMASNKAARGYANKIEHIDIEALLPQHGSVISKKDVKSAIEYLKELQCGTDIAYPSL